jgi:glutaredoxin
VPAGTELGPFLEAVSGEPRSAPSDLRPAALRIFVAQACPHCPTAVRTLLSLITPGGPVALEVIDSEACPEAAETEKVKSVPTLILDDSFRWTGDIRSGDLEALLTPGDRTDLDAGLLGRALENGNAGPLAALMAEADRISPALADLLAAEAMSVRIGAMMVVEELLEQAPSLVERFVPALRERFDAAPEPARGDMLYILGEAGPPSLKTEIEALLAGDLHPEVAEAAREALERLDERHTTA